jgi:hypothetical protein
MTDTATPTRPDASVMNGVIPYVGYRGRANEAADFYARLSARPTSAGCPMASDRSG